MKRIHGELCDCETCLERYPLNYPREQEAPGYGTWPERKTRKDGITGTQWAGLAEILATCLPGLILPEEDTDGRP